MDLNSLPDGAYVVAGFVDMRHQERNVRLGVLRADGNVDLTDEGRAVLSEIESTQAPVEAPVEAPAVEPARRSTRRAAKPAEAPAPAASEAPSLADELAGMGA